MNQKILITLAILPLERNSSVDFKTNFKEFAQIKTWKFEINLNIQAVNIDDFNCTSIFFKYNICTFGVKTDLVEGSANSSKLTWYETLSTQNSTRGFDHFLLTNLFIQCLNLINI